VIAISIVVSLLLFWIPGDELQSFVQSVVQNTLAYPFMALALTLMYFALARPAAEPMTPATPGPAAPPPAP
jgi:hypothetical protein